MKKLIYLTLSLFLIAGVATASAQDTKKTETFKVDGNCDMCKGTIEGSLKKKDGILSKKWSKTTKELTVTFDTTKINLQQVAEKVAAAGYDNQYAKAPDSAYNSLHSCCQYDRAK